MDEFLELCSQESRLTSQERREWVKSLLEKGRLNPLQRHGDAGWYPLHYAAKYGRGEVIQLLVSESQCDPRLQTRDGRSTALHVACEHRQAEAVEALCRLIPDGALAKRDKNGNTPLHVACRSGSMEIVSRLTRKYRSARCMNETNRAGSTPFGTAVREGHPSVARFFMSQEVGNPASKFSDFREVFPSFRHKQSLDHPVSIFVMGNRKTGKSTLIKSTQIEGVFNRAVGLFLPTSNVEYHSGGIVASDVSSSGYGRVKFYELASCKQSTQENIFSTFARNGKAIFVITVSFKLELKQIEATLLYWLSFIHHQFKPSKMPNVVVVGSFLFHHKLGSLRLENHHRLHIAYHRVLSTHQELCSHFHFIGKFSMDCRRSKSPGMDQFRKALHRKCREFRPSGGEVPSSCYVLWNALHAMRPGDSDPPIVKLSEIQQIVSEHSSTAPVSLFSLLPSHTENPPPSPVEDIHSLLVKLEEHKAVIILRHLDSEDPWVVFDELKLITQIDSALIQRAMRLSAASYLNPAIMSDDKLVHCLSPLSNSLKKEVLLNILHHFMIMEVMARGNDTKYFLPSVLNISPSADGQVQEWKMDDASYTIGFAQCVVPQPDQVIPVFMPRFLYFLLYELFSSLDDYENVSMSQSALHFEIAQLMQVYITIDSSAIVVNMRCSQSGIFSCLKFRNLFESIIHRQRELLQPMVKITEYIVPIESVNLPVMKVKHILAHGIKVGTLKDFLITKSTTSPSAESMLKLRSFEPYEWLSKLQKSHLNSLLDHRLTNVQVSKLFIRDLASCVGSNWKKLLEFSDDLQNCDTSPHSDENSSSEPAEPPDRPTHRVLIEVFSSMSIFQTNLASALKNPEKYRIPSTPLIPRRDSESNQSESQNSASPGPPDEEGEGPLDKSLSYLPPSSSSSTSHSIINTSGHDLSQPSQPDGITIKTCSTSSDASSMASTSNTNTNVPSMKIGRATLPSSQFPQEIQFVSQPQSLKCVSTGGTHRDEVHRISFTIPPQAVQDGGEVEIEYAVAAVGPFTFPDTLTPVSLILWVRVKGQEKLRKPIKIGVPHAVHASSQQVSRMLHVLCAQDQGDSYSFVRAHKASKIQSNRGILSTKLSKSQYFFCVAAARSKEVVSQTQYCLVRVTPNFTRSTLAYSWKLYFFVTYALPACVELVRQQFTSDHSVEEKGFLFDTSGEDNHVPSITMEYTKITPEHWTITKEGCYKQIEASQVELGMNKSSFEMSYHMYPPNFTICLRGHQAVGHSSVEFSFRGTTQTQLLYDIPLTLPRRLSLTSTSTLNDFEPDSEMDPKYKTQVSDTKEPERDVFRHYGGRSSRMSTKSEPIIFTIPSLQRISGGYSPSPPRNTLIDQMNFEKKNAMEVLTSNYDNICQQLTNRVIRRALIQQRGLTIEQGQALMDYASVSESDANERLIQMIEKGGVNGFRQFMIALQKTSEEHQGHQDLLLRMVSELNHLRPYSRSASDILNSMPLQHPSRHNSPV